MRVSAVLLLVLALGWFLDRHLIHDRSDLDYAFMADRWANPFWRAWDAALLLLALGHGGRGVTTVLDDRIHDPRWRAALKLLTVVVASTLALVVLVAVVGFTPRP